MGQEGCHDTATQVFTAEYKREAVAMLDAPGVTVNQIATELGIGAGMLGRWSSNDGSVTLNQVSTKPGVAQTDHSKRHRIGSDLI